MNASSSDRIIDRNKSGLLIFRDLSSEDEPQVPYGTTSKTQSSAKAGEEIGYSLLDLTQVRRLRDLGGTVREMGAYLALLASTNASSTITCGGERSIRDYTGLSRSTAKAAMTWLINYDFVRPLVDRDAKGNYAIRALLPWSGWSPQFTDIQILQLERVLFEQSSNSSSVHALVQRACNNDLLIQDAQGQFTKIMPTTRLAHVPNAFIRRKAGTSSLERLVRADQGKALFDALELMQFTGGGQDAMVPADVYSRELVAKMTVVFRNLDLHCFDVGSLGYRPRNLIGVDLGLGDLLQSIAVLEQYGVIEWLVFAGRKLEGVPVAPEEYLGTIQQSTISTDGLAGMAPLLASALHDRITGRIKGPLEIPDLEHTCKDQQVLSLPWPQNAAQIAAVFLLRFVDRSGKLGTSDCAIERTMRRSAEDFANTLLRHFPSEKALAKAILQRRKT